MSYKPIINGIDVSECRFYEPKAQKMTCHEETITKPYESTPICYYKLLQKSYIEIQRLQKENEKLNIEKEKLENKLQLRMASDKESDEYWDDIFSQKDYPFNKENVYKELSDYYFVLNQLPTIYMEITGGRLSKTTYFASSVIEAYNDAIQDYWSKIDDFETKIYNFKRALEEIRERVNKLIDSKGYAEVEEDRIMQLLDEVLNEK